MLQCHNKLWPMKIKSSGSQHNFTFLYKHPAEKMHSPTLHAFTATGRFTYNHTEQSSHSNPIHSDYAPKIADCSRTLCMRTRVEYTTTCYSLYGRFRPLLPSCLLVQWESSRLLCFRFAVRSHCWVIFFFKFCSVSVCFLYNFSIVICHLFSLTSTFMIICVCRWYNVLFSCKK